MMLPSCAFLPCSRLVLALSTVTGICMVAGCAAQATRALRTISSPCKLLPHAVDPRCTAASHKQDCLVTNTHHAASNARGLQRFQTHVAPEPEVVSANLSQRARQCAAHLFLLTSTKHNADPNAHAGGLPAEALGLLVAGARCLGTVERVACTPWTPTVANPSRSMPARCHRSLCRLAPLALAALLRHAPGAGTHPLQLLDTPRKLTADTPCSAATMQQAGCVTRGAHGPSQKQADASPSPRRRTPSVVVHAKLADGTSRNAESDEVRSKPVRRCCTFQGGSGRAAACLRMPAADPEGPTGGTGGCCQDQ
jgi:hypothetical protein